MHKNSIKKILKQFWFIVWEDDSWYSWIISALVAFLLIKFIVYPILGLVFATSYPIVAVVSGSMEHPGTFNDFWNDRAICASSFCTQGEFFNEIDITKETFQTFSFKNGFNTGDIMILFGNTEKEVGDIIVFMSKGGQPIIHRIIKKYEKNGETLYQTKGDNNELSINIFSLKEIDIQENTIIGEAKFRLPYLGYVKIWFVNLLTLLHIV